MNVSNHDRLSGQAEAGVPAIVEVEYEVDVAIGLDGSGRADHALVGEAVAADDDRLADQGRAVGEGGLGHVLMVTQLPPACQQSYRIVWYPSSMTAAATTVAEVPVPPEIARELRAVKRSREANDDRAMAAVVRARDAKCSLREIAELLGMTHTGVAKMERRARRGQEET
jgi:hypothetical protein